MYNKSTKICYILFRGIKMKKISLILLLGMIFSFTTCGNISEKVVGEYERLDELASDFVHSGVEAYSIGVFKECLSLKTLMSPMNRL